MVSVERLLQEIWRGDVTMVLCMDKQIEIKKSEGAFVDLLNREIKELQESQKRVEEMARVICGFACDYENCDICPFNCVNVPCEYHDYAINLINADYHKGETVSYQAMIDAQNADMWQQGYEQGKKETVKKVYDYLFSEENTSNYDFEAFGVVHVFEDDFREFSKDLQ